MKKGLTYSDIMAGCKFESQMQEVSEKIKHLFELGYSPAQIIELIGIDDPAERHEAANLLQSIKKEWAPEYAKRIYNAANQQKNQTKSGQPPTASRFTKFMASLKRLR
jgi:hypothetical protein